MNNFVADQNSYFVAGLFSKDGLHANCLVNVYLFLKKTQCLNVLRLLDI